MTELTLLGMIIVAVYLSLIILYLITSISGSNDDSDAFTMW